jgi:AraC-like DNA-binding protein
MEIPAMPDIHCPPVSLTDPDFLRQLLRTNMLDCDVGLHDSHPMEAQVELRQAGNVRAMKIDLHHPLSASRSAAQIAKEDTSYIVLTYQQTGRIISRVRSKTVTVEPGEIFLAHTAIPRETIAPDRARHLTMLIPADHFHEHFPEVKRGDGCQLLRPNSNTLALLAGCLDTFAEKVFPRAQEPAAPAIDLILDIFEAALLDQREPTDQHTPLFERIIRFIDDGLIDSSLTPTAIAQAHGISVRYLHLLFSRRGITVGGWIRNRRLEACIRALSNPRKQRSVTELALKWGFFDAAHFSKAFKSAYGISPASYRRGCKRGAIRLP